MEPQRDYDAPVTYGAMDGTDDLYGAMDGPGDLYGAMDGPGDL
jgi:hypothetical protein